MNESDNDRDVVDTAKTLFDDSVDRLDAAALSRLNRGRHLALEELARGGRRSAWLRWAPVSGVAAASTLAVLLTMNPEPPAIDEPLSASDFEILMEQDSLEMLEDLEFYAWLELTGAGPDVG